MAVSSQDLIKFLTQQFVQYMDTPKDIRQQHKQQKKELRVHWKQQWFGMIPQALSMLFKKQP